MLSERKLGRRWQQADTPSHSLVRRDQREFHELHMEDLREQWMPLGRRVLINREQPLLPLFGQRTSHRNPKERSDREEFVQVVCESSTKFQNDKRRQIDHEWPLATVSIGEGAKNQCAD